MHTLNLGILAHVDAGKTTLTERLLYAAGAIDSIGRVDDGNTQTDTLALEQSRGITIKSAVASFVLGDVTVNLLDTPGHPDFIAEVERVLSVLDGVVLVISAVEGVQAQTRVLMKTLQRLRLPTVMFVNKIDRAGADPDQVVRNVAATLTPDVVTLSAAADLGTRQASAGLRPFEDPDFRLELTELLADHDDAFLADYLADEAGIDNGLQESLQAQARRAAIHPIFFGSAGTGAGIDDLMDGISTFLPSVEARDDQPATGAVFKIDRGPAGEKVAYVRMFSGVLHIRDRIALTGRRERKITALSVYDRGGAARQESVSAGQIAKVWGLVDAKIGDTFGSTPLGSSRHYFAEPTLETVVVPVHPAEKASLRRALDQLTEQDPLINLRQDDERRELSLSLYGEVQKEVIQSTLATDYGLEVSFRETTAICIERLIGTGSALEEMHVAGIPFLATIGLRMEPAPVGSGVNLELDLEVVSMPLFRFRSAEIFRHAMEETVRTILLQGLAGWQVPDCHVTMTQCDYSAPGTTAGDYRNLAPLVVMAALREAQTSVCEPIQHFELEIPADTLGQVLPALGRLGAVPEAPDLDGTSFRLGGTIRAEAVHELQQQLPGLTHGEGVLETVFDHHAPVQGTRPRRRRTGLNPLNRRKYLLSFGAHT